MTDRCPICEWSLAERREDGCVLGDCSFRPAPGSEEWRMVQRNRERLNRKHENIIAGLDD